MGIARRYDTRPRPNGTDPQRRHGPEPALKGLRHKSEQNWLAAEACRKERLYDAAASRLYYSVFQAVYLSAKAKRVPGVDIPERKDQGSKHSAMITFVKVVGGSTQRRVYLELRALRETADYEPEPVEQAKYEALVQGAAEIRDCYLRRAQT